MHGHPRSPSLRVSDGETGVPSISGVNEATNANEADQRRAARKRFRAQYRALYDELVEILFQLDPIGVHFDKAEKVRSRSDDDHGTIARGPIGRRRRTHYPTRTPALVRASPPRRPGSRTTGRHNHRHLPCLESLSRSDSFVNRAPVLTQTCCTKLDPEPHCHGQGQPIAKSFART
jgi:hypothetical protein